MDYKNDGLHACFLVDYRIGTDTKTDTVTLFNMWAKSKRRLSRGNESKLAAALRARLMGSVLPISTLPQESLEVASHIVRRDRKHPVSRLE